MKDCKISVIVPVYNAENYIQRCILSLLKQTLDDVEIIIIDDGSTDNSLAIIKETVALHTSTARQKKINIISRENKGVAYTRSQGLRLSQGEFIIHFDSDDWAKSNMLEEMYKTIVSYNADMVICDYFLVKNNKETLIKQRGEYDPEKCIRYLLTGELEGFTWNKLIRKKYIDKNKIDFDNEITYMEDFLFILNVLLHHPKIIFQDDAYYYYQKSNPKSLTNHASVNRLSEMIKAVNEIENKIKKYNAQKYLNNDFQLFKLKQKIWFISISKLNVNDNVWDLFPETNSFISKVNVPFYYKVVFFLDSIKMRFFSNKIIYLIGLVQVLFQERKGK
ncbi:glycosyltransferase family 2 protein [Shigella flexneri]